MPVDMNKAQKVVEGKLKGERIKLNNNHFWYRIEVPEPITPIEIQCPFNHPHHDMSDNILKSIAKSMGVQTRFLKDIFSCTKDHEDLVNQLRKEDRRLY